MGSDNIAMPPTMITRSKGERMVISMFQFGIVAARPWKVPDPKSYAHAGAGAFNLVRRQVYESLGTLEALRMEVVEDLALARRVKRSGFGSRTVAGPGLISLHWASGAMGIV